jgi:hypothetical protein
MVLNPLKVWGNIPRNQPAMRFGRSLSWYQREDEGKISLPRIESQLSIPLSDPGFRHSEKYFYKLRVYALIFIYFTIPYQHRSFDYTAHELATRPLPYTLLKQLEQL